MLRTLLFTGIVAGLLSGILLTAVQHFQVLPLIQEAEKHETVPAGQDKVSSKTHAHKSDAHGTTDIFGKRNLLTLLSNILAGIGFSWLLVACMNFGRFSGWKHGLLFGLAGYTIVFIAPSLGLTPTLPGSTAALLEHRQLWWIATATCTAVGLALLFLSPNTLLKGTGVILLAVPHIFGAPQPEVVTTITPAELNRSFVIATAIANGIFWIAIGILTGYLLQRFSGNTAQAGK